jgi:SAM-dependent methyltransferase
MKEKPKDYHRFGDPKGVEGREALESMNVNHRELSKWAISLLPEINPKKILDVGCGGGMQLFMLGSEFPEAYLHGVDISEDALNLAFEVNLDKIEAGRCVIEIAPAEELHFSDETFDLVSAFETYFFWTDLKKGISEAYRVLVPGGILTVVSEQYPHPDFDERNVEIAERTGFKLVENEEMASLLEDVGFSVEYVTVPENNWVCFIAEK